MLLTRVCQVIFINLDVRREKGTGLPFLISENAKLSGISLNSGLSPLEC